MRKLSYFVASTIDGFIADPSGDDPSTSVFLADGDHIDPLFAEYSDIVPVHIRNARGFHPENKRWDTALEGRKSYENGLKEGIADAYPHLRHYVFSTSIVDAPTPSVEIVSGDPVAKTRELKHEAGKDIWLCGGGTLAATLRSEIDELIVKLHPVVLGSGIPMFSGGFLRSQFELADTQIYDSGVIFLTYRKK